MPSAIQRAIFYGKYLSWNSRALRFYSELLRNERLSRDEITDLNWRKRKRLISYAFDRVPFYRRKYARAGVVPEDIRRPEDFERIPPLSKEELRHCFDELLADGVSSKHMRLSTTGGSTGEP